MLMKMDFTLKELSLSDPPDHENVPGSSGAVELRDRRLVCVEYPAMIASVDKMLDTLGGEKTVSKVSSDKCSPKTHLHLKCLKPRILCSYFCCFSW